MLRSRRVIAMLPLGLMVLVAGMASAQTYPNKPIRVVDGAAGGGTDFTARLVAQGISGPLGQPVIVDNRPPGVGQGEIVSKAPVKTPAAIINRLSQEIARFVNRADVKAKFFDAGVDTVGSSPEEFADKIKSQMAIWSKVIADAGIKAD